MGDIRMSQKERQRLELFAQVRKEALSLVEVAALLPLSYRQCKRVWKRYQTEGDVGLVHRLRGRPSTHRKPESQRAQALALVRTYYADFGPTLAAEMLAKHHALALDPETLRRWLIADGQWQRHRRRSPHCQRRERKAHTGELVQIDGSHHDWFEGRAPQCALMVLVDDATSHTALMLNSVLPPKPAPTAGNSRLWRCSNSLGCAVASSNCPPSIRALTSTTASNPTCMSSVS